MAVNKPKYLIMFIGYIIFIVGYYFLANSVGKRDGCKGKGVLIDLPNDPDYGGGIAGVVIGLLLIAFSHLLPARL
jgi:hypothetical protein